MDDSYCCNGLRIIDVSYRYYCRSFLLLINKKGPYDFNKSKKQHYFINNIYVASTALESLDLYGTMDSLGVSLDSRQWAGGALLLAGVTGTKAISFTGARKTASLITGDFGLPGARSVLTLARPIIDSGSGSVAVASRVNLDDAINYTTPVAADDENRIGLRSAGRYHRIKTIPSGLWTFALAVDVDIAPQGTR